MQQLNWNNQGAGPYHPTGHPNHHHLASHHQHHNPLANRHNRDPVAAWPTRNRASVGQQKPQRLHEPDPAEIQSLIDVAAEALEDELKHILSNEHLEASGGLLVTTVRIKHN